MYLDKKHYFYLRYIQIVSFMGVLLKESIMQNKLSTRKATIADIPFLARIQYEASLPAMERCFWEDILVGTQTSALQFIESMLRAEASNWGNASDFLIVETQGLPSSVLV